jgi:hypothetical protein
MFGGRDGSGNDLNETWAWDGFTWTQISIRGPSPSPRSGPAMTFDAAHSGILLFGGVQGTTALTDTWSLDGFSWNSDVSWPRHRPTREASGWCTSSANNSGALSQPRYDFGFAQAQDVLTAVMFGGPILLRPSKCARSRAEASRRQLHLARLLASRDESERLPKSFGGLHKHRVV